MPNILVHESIYRWVYDTLRAIWLTLQRFGLRFRRQEKSKSRTQHQINWFQGALGHAKEQRRIWPRKDEMGLGKRRQVSEPKFWSNFKQPRVENLVLYIPKMRQHIFQKVFLAHHWYYNRLWYASWAKHWMVI